MVVRRLIPVLIFMTIGFAGSPHAIRAADKKEPSLGEKVLAYCEQHKGEQVGNGECATLAGQALIAAGARRRGKDDPNGGDYTWGDLIYTIKAEAGGPKGTASDRTSALAISFSSAMPSSSANAPTARAPIPSPPRTTPRSSSRWTTAGRS